MGICEKAKERDCWNKYKCTHALEHHVVYGCRSKCGHFPNEDPQPKCVES